MHPHVYAAAVPGFPPDRPANGTGYRLSSVEGGDEDEQQPAKALYEGRGDDLPYVVEVWDETKTVVEQVLAVTAYHSIGQAAFVAATQTFPDRYVTLRHKGRTVASCNPP